MSCATHDDVDQLQSIRRHAQGPAPHQELAESAGRRLQATYRASHRSAAGFTRALGRLRNPP